MRNLTASHSWLDEAPKRVTVKPTAGDHIAHAGDWGSEERAQTTEMAFQRTRMAADRTLMAVIRTSLSLISFGFTIFQFFRHLQDSKLLDSGSHAARNFGAALVYLGAGMILIGIVYHIQFMWSLRRERYRMTRAGLMHSAERLPVSFTLVVALLLLLIGIFAITSVTFNVGPF
jgi:inner membrane protein YidH